MRSLAILVVGCLVLAGCGGSDTGDFAGFSTKDLDNGEPSHVIVQHVLIGFVGSVPGKTILRTEAEAAELAQSVVEKANAGEDFGALVKQFTDDAYPGVYLMANTDQTVPTKKIYFGGKPIPSFARKGMVGAFGDVGFKLKAGEVGLAEHGENSPFGWHVIKRVR